MDKEIIFELVVGLLAIIVGMISFNVKSFKGDHETLTKEHEKLKDNHNSLALKVSENYASKTDLNLTKMEFVDAIKRVHERIDAGNENMNKQTNTIIAMLKNDHA